MTQVLLSLFCQFNTIIKTVKVLILIFKILLIIAEGIQLTGYHRLGTIHVSRPIQRHNNGGLSDVANTAHLDTEAVKKLTVPKESTLR